MHYLQKLKYGMGKEKKKKKQDKRQGYWLAVGAGGGEQSKAFPFESSFGGTFVLFNFTLAPPPTPRKDFPPGKI